jgi:ribosomal-protein-alanine N-acetyltransferase
VAVSDWPGFQPFLNDRRLCVWRGEQVVGALAWREVAPDEREILYLETLPRFRRAGVATRLLRDLVKDFRGTVYLEVRESNAAAIQLYSRFGFTTAGKRAGYYQHPEEAALVLKFCSC